NRSNRGAWLVLGCPQSRRQQSPLLHMHGRGLRGARRVRRAGNQTAPRRVPRRARGGGCDYTAGGRVVTRDEVAREDERHGGALTGPRTDRPTWTIQARDAQWTADDSGERVTRKAGAIIGEGDSPREAYLEACKREGKSPF